MKIKIVDLENKYFEIYADSIGEAIHKLADLLEKRVDLCENLLNESANSLSSTSRHKCGGRKRVGNCLMDDGCSWEELESIKG